jgi:hypothetical protein
MQNNNRIHIHLLNLLYCSKTFYKYKQVSNNLLYNDFIVNIYIYNLIVNKFLQLASPSPYKYSNTNSINKTNQMTANVQAISIISKLSKIISN